MFLDRSYGLEIHSLFPRDGKSRLPTDGKKLRIGVPVKVGFTEFVTVTKSPSTNTTDVTGFSIDVFKAAVELLAFALPFDFIPFAKPDGTSAGSYDDLCYQVYLGERVVSNLARFVMSIWIFVVLILTINYTASLASLYTVQQLQPSVTNIKDLIRKGESIGYLNNSYVYDILKQVGFDDSKIKRFRTMRGIDEALSKGSGKVGVAAVVDQTPNMKLFAILKLTGTERILDIEKKWFKEGRNCQDLNSPKVSSNSLGLESFWVLFLISGVASILALIIFIASFIYRHGHILMHPADSEAST
ncbi:hypothetical protein ACE6H2_004059 [Prunus campanulata]